MLTPSTARGGNHVGIARTDPRVDPKWGGHMGPPLRTMGIPQQIHPYGSHVGAGLDGKAARPGGITSVQGSLPEDAKTRPYNGDMTHRGGDVANRHPLSEIVRAFKSFSARRINHLRNTHGMRVWQRNYFEHIIRNEEDYTLIRAYILNNPQRWQEDRFHPAAPTKR